MDKDRSMDNFIEALHKDMETTVFFVDYKGNEPWKNRMVNYLLRYDTNTLPEFADAFANKYPTYHSTCITQLIVLITIYISFLVYRRHIFSPFVVFWGCTRTVQSVLL